MVGIRYSVHTRTRHIYRVSTLRCFTSFRSFAAKLKKPSKLVSTTMYSSNNKKGERIMMLIKHALMARACMVCRVVMSQQRAFYFNTIVYTLAGKEFGTKDVVQ